MNPQVQIAIAAVAAALLACVGPRVLAALPEPAEPAEDKLPYRDVAAIRNARWVMVIPAAIAAAIIAWRVGVPELLPVWILLCGVGSWLAFVDWHTRYLPFRLTAPLFVALWLAVGAAAWLLNDTDLLVRTAIANLIVYLLFFGLYLVANRFFRGGLGFGDVRLAAIIAVALAPLNAQAVGIGLYAGFAIGAVFGFILQKRGVVDGDNFAFGPYLLIGAVVGAAWTPV